MQYLNKGVLSINQFNIGVSTSIAIVPMYVLILFILCFENYCIVTFLQKEIESAKLSKNAYETKINTIVACLAWGYDAMSSM